MSEQATGSPTVMASATGDPNSVEDFERSVTTAVENLDLYKDKMIERSSNFSHLTFCSRINNYYDQKFFM